MREPKNVLIVGAGITGALTSFLLKRVFADRLRVEIWDKGRGIGGRMSTSRMSREAKLSCDLGIQYITTTPTHWEEHKTIYEDLLSKGLLTPLDKPIVGMREYVEGTQHFVAPRGASSIPKYFVEQAGCKVRQNTLLGALNVAGDHFHTHASDTSNPKDHQNVEGRPDIIIMTIPPPQILNLTGGIEHMLTPFRTQLQGITYSSRYALGLFFPNMTSIPGVDWCAKYVYDNPCIRYVSIDSQKRNADPDEGVSMVVHASIPFSIENLEKTFDEVQPMILSHLRDVIPDLPEAEVVKTHRWRYSQVSKPYAGEPGCVAINNMPLLLCAGDGFTHSNFDNCVNAAQSVLNKVMEVLEQSEN